MIEVPLLYSGNKFFIVASCFALPTSFPRTGILLGQILLLFLSCVLYLSLSSNSVPQWPLIIVTPVSQSHSRNQGNFSSRLFFSQVPWIPALRANSPNRAGLVHPSSWQTGRARQVGPLGSCPRPEPRSPAPQPSLWDTRLCCFHSQSSTWRALRSETISYK